MMMSLKADTEIEYQMVSWQRLPFLPVVVG